jgi:hypothetical protein
MNSRLRKLTRWWVVCVLSLLLLSFDNSGLHLNPAEKAASPYLYNLAQWEFGNLLSKWTYRLSSLLSWGYNSELDGHHLAWEYFRLGEQLGQKRSELRYAVAQGGDDAGAFQVELEALRAERDRLTSEVEETIEASISAVLAEEELAFLGWFVFPPVDIRLGEPPKLLITSPRDRIQRTHDVLLESSINLEGREGIEDTLLEEANMSALVEDIGGIATYPASIPATQPMHWTLQTAAHEWLHHYFFFKPLGQNMFDDGKMLSLNETIASIAGREIGDRAYEMLGGEVAPRSTRRGDAQGNSSGYGGEEGFDFHDEMRETRLRVDELLGEGMIVEAETYMEERRRLFVENGYPIRKLNQAYFAFYGTYADTSASSSPIGDQVDRLRQLIPDLGTFISTVANISSYQQFLNILGQLEAKAAGS